MEGDDCCIIAFALPALFHGHLWQTHRDLINAYRSSPQVSAYQLIHCRMQVGNDTAARPYETIKNTLLSIWNAANICVARSQLSRAAMMKIRHPYSLKAVFWCRMTQHRKLSWSLQMLDQWCVGKDSCHREGPQTAILTGLISRSSYFTIRQEFWDLYNQNIRHFCPLSAPHHPLTTYFFYHVYVLPQTQVGFVLDRFVLDRLLGQTTKTYKLNISYSAGILLQWTNETEIP